MFTRLIEKEDRRFVAGTRCHLNSISSAFNLIDSLKLLSTHCEEHRHDLIFKFATERQLLYLAGMDHLTLSATLDQHEKAGHIVIFDIDTTLRVVMLTEQYDCMLQTQTIKRVQVQRQFDPPALVKRRKFVFSVFFKRILPTLTTWRKDSSNQSHSQSLSAESLRSFIPRPPDRALLFESGFLTPHAPHRLSAPALGLCSQLVRRGRASIRGHLQRVPGHRLARDWAPFSAGPDGPRGSFHAGPPLLTPLGLWFHMMDCGGADWAELRRDGDEYQLTLKPGK
eukprot:gnl/Dysnectes_brevis/6856_a10957_282.p1 GENE.gnl/Dysnectes_brevis/6856_a10957_282~~gnl/Dysnectes_brevis/6856_a10957_282.p1  ORF type:complete len:282 (+),score=12.05 gnl/Dysnectes_brevis/6856_a10957_282:57-902(+)